MIALINGEEGTSFNLFKGGATLLQLALKADGEMGPSGQVLPKGTPLDVTGDTVSLELYDASNRVNATPVKSIAAAIVTAAAGILTITVANATVDFGPGKYFGYVKRSENLGTTLEFSRKYFVITVI